MSVIETSTKVVYFDGNGVVVEPTSSKVRGFRLETKSDQGREGDIFSKPSSLQKIPTNLSGRFKRK